MRPTSRVTSPLVAATLMTRVGRVTSALVAAALVTTFAMGPARAEQPANAKTLDDLLDTIKRSTSGEDAALKQREAAFRANRDQRNAMLKAAEKRLADAQRRGAELERRFDDQRTFSISRRVGAYRGKTTGHAFERYLPRGVPICNRDRFRRLHGDHTRIVALHRNRHTVRPGGSRECHLEVGRRSNRNSVRPHEGE